MARIQLRDTTIYIQDGFSGTANIDDTGVLASGETQLTIDTVDVNDNDGTGLIPVGARFTIENETQASGCDVVHTITSVAGGPPTTTLNFTPQTAGGVVDGAELTFLPQRIEVKIGDGDLSWTEAREMIYDLDRDTLDTVRQGADQPVEIDLAFTFEYVTTQSGQVITPVDAIKQINEASAWVSSSADACEPYAVDIYVVHCVPCGTDYDEDYTFEDFRYENLDYSMQDATISVSGRCNITDVVVSRSDSCEC